MVPGLVLLLLLLLFLLCGNKSFGHQKAELAFGFDTLVNV
jgi:hypothetical protein